MDEHVNCNEAIARLRAGIRDAESALRNSRDYNGQLMARFAKYEGTEQERRRAWAQEILIEADMRNWDEAEIAADLAGIASAVSEA